MMTATPSGGHVVVGSTLAALPALVLLAAAGNLAFVTTGWLLAIVLAGIVTARYDGRPHAVRLCALHAVTLPLVPALAAASGVPSSWLALTPGVTAALAATGAVVVIGRSQQRQRRGRAARRRGVDDYTGQPIVAGAAGVLAIRVAMAAGPTWTGRVLAGGLTFMLLTVAWRIAALVDLRRRRSEPRRRLAAAWRRIEVRGLERSATTIGQVVEEWGAVVSRLAPITLAGQARLVAGGLVGVLAYLLWTR